MFGNTKPFGSPFGQTTQQSTFGKPAAFGSTTFGQQPAQPAFGCKHIRKQFKKNNQNKNTLIPIEFAAFLNDSL